MKALSLKAILPLLLFASIAITSCKKDPPPAPQPVIEGSWIGKYGVGIKAPSSFYAFNILPGGKLEIKSSNNTVKGQGTWTLDGVTFTGVYTYTNTNETYNLAAKFDETEKTLFGSWGEGQVSAADGEFYLNKE